MHWTAKDFGIAIGYAVGIVVSQWHLNSRSTNKVIDILNGLKKEITDLTGRVFQIENAIRTYDVDSSSMRDRVSRGEARTDMLYLITAAPGRDPFPDAEQDKRQPALKPNHGRRRTDYQPARDGEDDD